MKALEFTFVGFGRHQGSGAFELAALGLKLGLKKILRVQVLGLCRASVSQNGAPNKRGKCKGALRNILLDPNP